MKARKYFHDDLRFTRDQLITSFRPDINVELWEWAALMRAVHAATESFTVIELGCGYGRWLLNAVGVMRSSGADLPLKLTGVEADETHYRWAQEAMADNGIEACLINAAVGACDGEADFMVHDRPGFEYGQRFVDPDFKVWADEHQYEYKTIVVPVVSLDTLLRRHDYVDFIDADIQGAEADVFEAAACSVNDKVGSVFIETHGLPLEVRLRSLFARMGWRCDAAFHPYEISQTPYGPIDFESGGVLVYRNPRFMPFATGRY